MCGRRSSGTLPFIGRPKKSLHRTRTSGFAEKALVDGVLACGSAPQPVEKRLEREVLEHVALEPAAGVLAQLEAVDEAPGVAPARVRSELGGAVEIEDLRLAPARDRDQVAKPEARPARGSGRARPCARGAGRDAPAARTRARSPAAPRFGSFSRRSLELCLDRRLGGGARLRGAVEQRPPRLGDHPLRVLERLQRRARRPLGLGPLLDALRPSEVARAAALPPARRAQASARAPLRPLLPPAAPRSAPRAPGRSELAAAARRSSAGAFRAPS